MKLLKELAGFLLLSLLTCLAVFQDAMWGRSIAAPLDIAPALWQHYSHVDPNQGPIPKNHYTVDQLSYDLPVQFLMHQAWRSGEIPWWNPYSYGGRPLLADGHCNGTDPIRLVVYFTVPNFVLAYNWTLILHAVGTGVGTYVLLRAFGTRIWVASLCSLAVQWAGGYVLYVGHPWVRASFLYYPWLWLAWHRALITGRGFPLSAPFFVAAIFYSGNLQSHSYLPIFAFCMVAAYKGRNFHGWREAAKIIVPAGILGALIASPVLVPQVELYFDAVRPVGEPPRLYWLETGAVLGAIHPWSAGTFRTVSIKGVSGVPSFHLAIGGVAVALAIFGSLRRNRSDSHRRALATAQLLVLSFLVIAFTPLHPILYLRASGLGIIGLGMLAAWGAEALLSSDGPQRSWSRLVWMTVAALGIGTAVLAHIIFPHFETRVEDLLLARAEFDGYGGATRELRKFQAANFTAEVSPVNSECALNLLGLVALGFAFARARFRLSVLFTACGLSLLPLLSFAERFITRCPIEAWDRLLNGGPLQASVVAIHKGKNARFVDSAPQDYLRIFPQEIPVLHRLHVAHGYTALRPQHVPFVAPVTVDATDAKHQETPSQTEPRFLWSTGVDLWTRVVEEKLNRALVSFPARGADVLIRTDTWYPGWNVAGTSLDAPRNAERGSAIMVPAGETQIVVEYRPRWFRECIAIAVLAAAVGGWLAWSNRTSAAHSL